MRVMHCYSQAPYHTLRVKCMCGINYKPLKHESTASTTASHHPVSSIISHAQMVSFALGR